MTEFDGTDRHPVLGEPKKAISGVYGKSRVYGKSGVYGKRIDGIVELRETTETRAPDGFAWDRGGLSGAFFVFYQDSIVVTR